MILSPSLLSKTIDAALSTGADFVDVFVEDTYSSQLSLLSSKPDQAIVGQLYGAGIRLYFGEEIIYVSTNDLTEEGLINAALMAAKSQKPKSVIKAMSLNLKPFDSIHAYGDKPWELDRQRKFKWLHQLNHSTRSQSSLVTQVEAVLNEKFQKVQIANSKGLLVYDERAYTSLTLESWVEDSGVKENAQDRLAYLATADTLDQIDLPKMAKENVSRALKLTKADFAPAGEMPVIIDNGFGGVLFHEACGHGLETTSVAKKTSVFCDKLGQKLANDCVTAIDDGTIPNAWGSLTIDDEGAPTEKTVLIEKGVLKSYLVDDMGSHQTQFKKTGSGRRQSYKYAPASRMRNTYIAAGKDKFEDLVRDVDFGLYAKKLGGGSVNTSTGDYNFQVREAYIIRRGRIEEVVKGASLIGRGIDTLSKITKVSDDLKLETGMCGSVSGSIPVCLGQPQVLVSSLMVGGKAK